MFGSRLLTIPLGLLAVLSILSIGSPNCQADEIAIKSGQKLAFLGDSITQFGAESPSGYVQLVISGLKANGVDVTMIPAGISGHTSKDMIARIDRDVIAKKPDWMTLSCGVNDVWHGAGGVALDPYKKNITDMVDKAQAAGIKVMILTSTMIGEDQANGNNQKLIEYNDFLRQLAKDKGCLLADLNADMQTAVTHAGGGKPGMAPALTGDGVHMNPDGNRMMAGGILKGFGLDDAQMAKAQNTWLDIASAVTVKVETRITLRQWDQLKVVAEQEHKPLGDFARDEFKKTIDVLSSNPAVPSK
jgi:lysophospholipase L1-like esterase